MLRYKVNLGTVGKKLKTLEIRVAIQAYGVVIGNCLLEIISIPNADPVCVGIVTAPARKTIRFKFIMYTLLVLALYLLKMIPGIFFISSVTVDAN